MMTTIQKIEMLLEELERNNRTQMIMINNDMVTRTDSGLMFYRTLINKNMEVIIELNEYPYHWIDAVKRILELRKN